MAIYYQLNAKDQLLFCKTSGYDENLEDTLAYGAAVMQACLDAGCTHVLCDERGLEYRLDTIDTYELAKYYAEHVPLVVKAAIVCNPAHIEDAEFWENVAINRGLSVRVFKNIEDAEAWLAG